MQDHIYHILIPSRVVLDQTALKRAALPGSALFTKLQEASLWGKWSKNEKVVIL